MTDLFDKVVTGDGTITLRDTETGELFHNSAGAYLEAVENYVRPSAVASLVDSHERGTVRTLSVLDVCFGLGYNSFALLEHVLADRIGFDNVRILGLEWDARLAELYPHVLEQACFTVLGRTIGKGNLLPGEPDLASIVFESDSGSGTRLSIEIKFDDFRRSIKNLDEHSFDLVFHDPFSPAKVPHLWTADIFREYRRILSPEGKVLTYSVASAVRGGLIESGFSIYRTAAVGRKSGGTLAIADRPPASTGESVDFSNIVKESSLNKEEIDKLLTASGVPYRDPTMSAGRKAVLKFREKEQHDFKQRN